MTQSLRGEGGGGGDRSELPLTLSLSPAFAEAASRRQAPGERGILWDILLGSLQLVANYLTLRQEKG